MPKLFYVDTCIYLNLWQKETGRSGAPYWKWAQEFFEKYNTEDTVFYYSGNILKELRFILGEKAFLQKREKLVRSENHKRLFLTNENIQQAREVERQLKRCISFYDILHLLYSKKVCAVLVTRDRKLIETAPKYGVVAKRPEEL
ncbi:MAG: type II toxin-antitoxin system VapC family toxin [Nanoarchaeota archaeon]